MWRRVRSSRFLLCGAGLSIAVWPAAEPAPRVLGAPIARYEGDFSFVSGVRELADGRVLATDYKEPAIYLLTAGRAAPVKLGSSGRGPGEYLKPGGIYAGVGDTSLVIDRGQPRVIVIDGHGRVVTSRSIQLLGTTGSSDGDIDFQRVDQNARSFFLGHADFRKKMASTGSMAVDTIPLLRLEPVSQKLDTVASLAGAEQKTVSTGPNSFFSRDVQFSAVDSWGVAANGRVAIVRGKPYRVDWIGTDRRVQTGPEIPIDEIRVNEKDKEEYRARMERGGPSMGIGTRNAQGTGTTVKTPNVASEAMFATVKPPFGLHDVFVSSDARVFVRRLRAAGVEAVIYDIFDDRGRRVDRIQLPARSKIVGTGTGTIFVVTLDNDDLPHLGKYKL